jgi:hypothetical protein
MTISISHKYPGFASIIKKGIFILLVISVSACTEKSETKIENQNSLFWQHRSQASKNIMEYPIKKHSDMSEQRANRVHVDNMESQFEIFVDDVLLCKMMGRVTQSGGGVATSFDLNPILLTAGTHELKIRIYPAFGREVFGEEGYLNFQVYHFKDRDLRTQEYNHQLNGHNGIQIDQKNKQWIEKWDPDNRVGYDGDYVAKQPHQFKGLPMYEWRTEFFAEVPFSYEGWRTSVNLLKEYENKKDALYDELFTEYKKIHEVIKNKDSAAFSSLIKEREDLVTATLFYKDAEKKIRSDDFIKLILDPDYEIDPLIEEAFQLEFQAYGKLVMFLHKADSEGIIRLRNKTNPEDVVYLDFRFHRKQSGERLGVI